MRRATVVSLVCLVALLALALPAAASDGDSDKVEDDVDNCVGSANPFQFDVDGDGVGDVCEGPLVPTDSFEGTDGVDLAFGSFRDSTLRGRGGADALYGLGGDDRIDGGSGPDLLVGGPGDDLLRGGPACDVFGIELSIEQRDVIVDYEPGIDRLRFPPRVRGSAGGRPPLAVSGGTDHLVVRFLVLGSPAATVEFLGVRPAARLVLSTEPCGVGPPPSSICPVAGAGRSLLFIGFDDLFCPGRGGLAEGIGVYSVPDRKIMPTKGSSG